MAECSECRIEVPPQARFCPGCGTAMPDGLCPACDEPTSEGAPFCMHCGVLKESWARSSLVLELARRAFSAGDLDELQGIADRLDGDEPHAPKVRELREELAERRLFARREDFRCRVEAAMEAEDRPELVRLRAEVADDQDLRKVLADLTGRETERRTRFQEQLGELSQAHERRDEVAFTAALMAARLLAVDRASLEEQLAPWEACAAGFVRDQLPGGWYLAILALGCVPFPLGLWFVSTVSEVQQERWTGTHPVRARTIGRLALLSGPSLAFTQVVLLGMWLLR